MDTNKMRVKMKMHRVIFIICSVLTFVGLVVVLVNGGDNHLEFVMVPVVVAAIFHSLYLEAKKVVDEWEKK